MRSCSIARVLVLLGAAGLWLPACGGNAGLGESCSSVSDCLDSLQCLDHVCVPRCERSSDCGDGHRCESGICELSTGEVGGICDSEYDCAPGLTCQPLGDDVNHDGVLTAECAAEHPGGVLDDACSTDQDCRRGACELGRCVDVCASDDDCPASHTCRGIPRDLGNDDSAFFSGCLPSIGTISYDLDFRQPYRHFLLPVPVGTLSFALVAEIDDPKQLVGAAFMRSPSGQDLYTLPDDRASYFDNLVRTDLARGTWTLIMPQVDVDLEAGAYVFELGSYLDSHLPGTDIPRVRAIYRFDDAPTVLDLHLYFMDLSNHPCALQGAALDAESAQTSTGFQTFLEDLRETFGNAGVLLNLEGATYADVTDRHDLDALDASKLGELLSQSSVDGGVNLFFVRTIAPAGVQALAGGPPSPPGLAGTTGSGVAIALDTLCYRPDWSHLARIAAHEIARSLGLMRSVEPDGYTDLLDDTGTGPGNLMFFSETGGDTLSTSQKDLLRRSPALRRGNQ